MLKSALGLIETIGLAAAMEAADAAVKSANVRLLGYELTKGDGMVVIKVIGDVGAVKAAVEAGAQAAAKVNRVFSTNVIPRPHHEIEKIVATKETVGLAAKEPVKPVKAAEPEPVSESAAVKSADEFIEILPQQIQEAEEVLPADKIETKAESAAEEKQEPEEEIPVPKEMNTEEITDTEPDQTPALKSSQEACNLCNDPACTRRKGEPRTTCIHYTG